MTTKALIDPSSAAQSILDYPLALSRVGGDKELLKELGDLFLEEYPQLLAEIHDAHKQGAAAQLGRVAHSLKGSVANFGAKDAVELAAQLEQCGAKGNRPRHDRSDLGTGRNRHRCSFSHRHLEQHVRAHWHARQQFAATRK